jgi:diacylglycerol kinase (ATP)
LSNEEFSVASEILDQRISESFSLNIGEMIQDLNDDRIGHIDSPEISDTTDALHGESIMDDISSVLGHDMLGALQDNTITEDTTTLCTIDPPVLYLPFNKNKNKHSDAVNDTTTQFGFENRVFDLHDISKHSTDLEQIKLPSLAKFEEGNDISRKSFKLLHRTSIKSASTKKLSNKNNPSNASIANDDLETTTIAERPIESDKSKFLNTIKIQIQVISTKFIQLG